LPDTRVRIRHDEHRLDHREQGAPLLLRLRRAVEGREFEVDEVRIHDFRGTPSVFKRSRVLSADADPE
jgi:hypothetical protein